MPGPQEPNGGADPGDADLDPSLDGADDIIDGGITDDEVDAQGSRTGPLPPREIRTPYGGGPRGGGPAAPPSSRAELPESRPMEVEFAAADRPKRDLGRITGALSALGANIRYRVNRLFPADLPPGEMGWSQWIRLLKSNPAQEDVESDIYTRFGGGEYEVHIRSADSQNPQEDTVTIRLSGPWRWQTSEGQQLFAQRYGVPAMQQVAATSPSGSAVVPPVGGDPSAPGGAFAYGAHALQMGLSAAQIAEREARQRESDQFDRLLRLKALEATGPKQGGGLAELAAVLTPLATLAAGMLQQSADRRAAEERERRDREEKRDAEFRLLMQQMQGRNQTPQEMVAATQAILEVYKDQTKMELGIKGDVLKAMLMRELGNGGTIKPESPLVGMLQDLFREVGPDVVKLFLAKAQATQTAMQPPQQPPPQQQGFPQNPPRAPQLPPAAPPQQPPTPPQPLAQGTSVWDSQPGANPAPTTPPTTPPAAPPQQPPTPTAPPPSAAADEMQRRTAAVSFQAAHNVLAILRAFSAAGNRPDPEAVWSYTDASGPQSTFDYLLLSPAPFMEAMKRTQAAPNGVMSFAAMVKECPHPTLVQLAQGLDADCAADGARYQYLRQVLEWRPWDVDTEGDDAPGAP
jgi:hypothetical protein